MHATSGMRHVDRDRVAPIRAFIKQQRFLGVILPMEYGGLGSPRPRIHAHREPFGDRGVTVPNSLGPGEPLLHWGAEQKQKYLARLACGEEIRRSDRVRRVRSGNLQDAALTAPREKPSPS